MTKYSALVAVLLALSVAAPAGAQDSKKDGSDPVQGLNSPFQVGSGATFLITQDKKSVTAALTGQLDSKSPINIWQLGVTGATNDEGKSLVYATSDTAAPGFKAKIGFGYSSFMTADTTDYRAQSRKFLDEAWCLDEVAAVSKSLPTPVARTAGQLCQAFLQVVQKSFASGPPANVDAAKAAKAVLDTLSTTASSVSPEKRSAACALFKNDAKDAFKMCQESGAVEKSPEDRKKDYPELYRATIVTLPPSFYYTIVGNYTPTLASAAYRDVVNGVADLSTNHEWVRMLQGATIDTALYYRRFAAGVSVGYLETADIKLSSVCKETTNGDYRAESCKDAMLGKPDPDRAVSVKTVLALDPLVMPTRSTIVRPGAQLELYYENPSSGKGYKSEIAVPFFLAPVESPMKLVVGVRPTWSKNTTGDDPDTHFSVMLFIGARPGVGR